MRTIYGEVNGCPVTIIDLNWTPVQCRMCGAWGDFTHFVWYYEEPCCSLHPDRGGAAVCKPCHDKWAAWDDDMLLIAEAYGVAAILHKRFPA